MHLPARIAVTVANDVVILDRIEPGWTPPYCTHGRTACIGCAEWVWLGDRTYQAVASGAALPLCLDCAHRLIPPTVRPYANLGDHRRSDGPHPA